MAQIVNIRRDVDDKFYRYRMPLLLTKIEGKGNGIKTVIPNMTDVSKALSRPPTYTTKFFGFELGAQTSSDEKTDRYIVNGAHNSDKLRELLDVFIDKFVLCGSCKNPETDLVLTKNDVIFRDCKACGQQTGIDMRHKLATFIIRNPPKKTKKSKGAHASAANGNNGGTGSPHSGEDGGSDDEFTKRLKADAAELPTAEQAKVNEDDWSLDTSAEAVRARKLESAVASLTLGDGDDSEGEDSDSPYTVVKLWIEENRTTITANDVFKKTQELGIDKKHRTLQILARSLFTDKIVQELPKFVVVLKKMVTSDKGEISEKHQKALMGGIERLVGVDHPNLVLSVPKILMLLYQSDVLEEDFIKQWGTHVSKKYVDRETSKKVRKASEPFLKWLDEADAED